MGAEAIALHGLGAGLALLGLQVIRVGYRNRARATAIEETETTPIRDLDVADPPVQVTGTARPTDEGTIPAHVDESEGVVVETVVQDWDEGDDHNDAGGHWDRRRRHVDAEPFVVDDGTGQAVVDPDEEHLRVELERTTVTVGRREDAPGPVRDHLDAVEYDRPDGRTVRYRQGAIEPGEEVYVYATAVEDRPGWDGAEAVLSTDPDGDETVVSDRSEAAVVGRTGSKGLKQYFVGAVLVALGASIGVLPFA